MRSPWRAALPLLAPLGALACDPGQPRAVIAVNFGAASVVRVAQAVIAETARSGEPIVVLQQDDRHESDMGAALRRAEWALALPDLVAVVGHESSPSTLTSLPLYREAGIPLLIPTATSPRLQRVPGAYPLAPDDSLQGAFLARFASQVLGARRPLLFVVNDEYGFGLGRGVTREFEALGNAVLEEIPISPTSNLEAMADAALRRSEADVVILAARYPEAWTVLRAVREHSPDIHVLAGDGAYIGEVPYQLAGPAADAMYLSVYWHPDAADSAGLSFIELYQRQTGRRPTPAEAMVYDAIMLAVRAVRTVGADARAVDRYLATLGNLSPAFQGLSGTITFQGPGTRSWLMVRATDGEFHLVEAP